jgi:hypothetical protein
MSIFWPFFQNFQTLDGGFGQLARISRTLLQVIVSLGTINFIINKTEQLNTMDHAALSYFVKCPNIQDFVHFSALFYLNILL